MGVGFIIVAHLRLRSLEAALRRGEFANVDDRLLIAVLAAGIVLGIGTVALVLFGT
jgi:hypothetical protein